jgi:hypothetical protein
MRELTVAFALVTLAIPTQAQSRFKTRWGDPDLQGLWSNATLTPLERPKEMADKPVLTADEVAEIDRTGLERTLKPVAPEVRLSGELNEIWLELGQVVRSRRSSLIVDPPDGKLPFTPEGKKRRDLALARAINLVPINSWEDRSLAERCLMTGGLLAPNPFYLNNHQIFQTRDHVVVASEVFHEYRIIPLDRRPSLGPGILLWSGDSRGRWEGETLVVETANFNGKGGFQGSSASLRLVERFTRVDADAIDYELTTSDPSSFTQPWTLQNTLRRIKGPILEYACHEGNYGMVTILNGARAQEKARVEEELKKSQDGLKR